MRERNIRLVLEYDGSEYCGYQLQKDDPTIQEELEKGLNQITAEEIRPVCAGRTDSGVHALGQVVNFTTRSSVPTGRFVPALNSTLPRDIRIRRADEVPEGFHAQLDAVAKIYCYMILNDSVGGIFLRRYSYHFRKPLNVEKMREAGRFFEGEHDFTSFRSRGCTATSPVKEIHRLRCHREGNLIHILVKGSGFLYNMVRIMTGTLIEVGLGKRDPKEIGEILAARDRRRAGPTAPPEGLCLIRVDYDRYDEGESASAHRPALFEAWNR